MTKQSYFYIKWRRVLGSTRLTPGELPNLVYLIFNINKYEYKNITFRKGNTETFFKY